MSQIVDERTEQVKPRPAFGAMLWRMSASMHVQTVVVTGATGNLGRAVAHAFGERGANLVLLGHRGEALATAFGADDARRLLAAVDLLDRQAVDAAIRSAV